MSTHLAYRADARPTVDLDVPDDGDPVTSGAASHWSLGFGLLQAAGERLPRLCGNAQGEALAVGGVTHQDHAGVAGCLYAGPVLAAER